MFVTEKLAFLCKASFGSGAIQVTKIDCYIQLIAFSLFSLSTFGQRSPFLLLVNKRVLIVVFFAKKSGDIGGYVNGCKGAIRGTMMG